MFWPEVLPIFISCTWHWYQNIGDIDKKNKLKLIINLVLKVIILPLTSSVSV